MLPHRERQRSECGCAQYFARCSADLNLSGAFRGRDIGRYCAQLLKETERDEGTSCAGVENSSNRRTCLGDPYCYRRDIRVHLHLRGCVSA